MPAKRARLDEALAKRALFARRLEPLMGRRPVPPGADSKFSKPGAMENLGKSRLPWKNAPQTVSH